ncbi:MAG: efflux RND transporter permease subunit [Fibromonadaceae bacterium]|jgi:hydrophobe/amphiphile efflux-1 (HAE1) family protein|nr:efflux RND transporter permease subunit [Fibromonadaceae bacterium]
MSISELSIKRPTFVVVVFTVLAFLGAISYNSLRYELMPNIDFPIFLAIAVYPGANPSEVENSVTKVLEEVLSGVPGVENLRGISRENVAIVIVQLKTGFDMESAVNDGMRLVNSARMRLPDDVQDPTVIKLNMNAMPVLQFAVRADNISATDLHDLLTYRILPEFSSVPGVGEVSTIASSQREMQVNVDPAKLQAQNLSLLQVVNTVVTNNLSFPAGNIKTDSLTSSIRLSAKYATIEDIGNTVIKRNSDGSLLKVADVAEVVDAVKEVSGFYRLDGQPAVGMYISKQEDANTVEVARLAKEKVKKLEEHYKEQGLKFGLAMDGSTIIKNSADAVRFDLILAVVFVAILMMLFLHSFRNGVIVMIAVPLSLVTAFIGLAVMDFTLNIITLLALSLMIGTLVDDAIVVLENIYRHMEMGKNAVQASVDGIKEIGLSVVSLTLVLLVVFLPVAVAPGILRPVFQAFSLTIVITVTISLLVAFTVVPLMTSSFGKLTHVKNEGLWGSIVHLFESAVNLLHKFIISILDWALNHRFTTLFLAALLFVISILLAVPTFKNIGPIPIGFGFVGMEMVANGDNDEVNVDLEYVKDISVLQNNEITRMIENDILQMQEVTSIYAGVGANSSRFSSGGAFKSSIGVKLVDKGLRSRSSEAFAADLERHINSNYAGVKATVVAAAMLGGGGGAQAPIQMVLQSSNRDELLAFANTMVDTLMKVDGIRNMKLSSDMGSPEVVVDIDREKMARLGLDLGSVGGTLQYAFAGNTNAQFLKGDYQYDINVRFDNFDRRSAEDVGNLTVMSQLGAPVKLKQIANISEGTGPNMMERYGRIPSITLNGNIEGRAVGDIGADVEAKLQEKLKGTDITYKVEGGMKQMADSFSALFIALFTSILLVYLVMVALYESYLYPFVVLFSIPLSIIGAMWALALTGNNLSIFSMLGIIMLVGLVAKNAILVVDFTNQIKKQKNSVYKALHEAVEIRFRPILMTAMACIIGMLPIALGSGAGSEWKRGIGWVIMGGMTSSMFLSLIVVPVIYSLLESMKIWAKRRLGMMHKDAKFE